MVVGMKPIATLDDLTLEAGRSEGAAFSKGRVFQTLLADAAPQTAPEPLLDEDPGRVDGWLTRWHRGNYNREPLGAVGCYFAADAIIAGRGLVFLDGRLVATEAMLPAYVLRSLDLPTGGSPAFHATAALPVRAIDEPCVAWSGHGVDIYGHFLVEGLPRLLVALRTLQHSGITPKFLIPSAAPGWLRKILRDTLGIADGNLVEHDPTRERVLLRQAILPTYVMASEGLHPFAATLFDDLVDRLDLRATGADFERIFVSRFLFSSQSFPRQCDNEADLLRIAAREFGFTPIFPETLSWKTQIALYSNAKIIAGPFGSALHNSIFAAAGATRLGAIGYLNLTQSAIGALRRHRMAYLRAPDRGTYSVDPDAFRAFMGALTA